MKAIKTGLAMATLIGSALLLTACVDSTSRGYSSMSFGVNAYDRDYRGTPYRGYSGQRDRDGDGIPDAYDRDRDGDGVPNRFDRAPNNPRRR